MTCMYKKLELESTMGEFIVEVSWA